MNINLKNIINTHFDNIKQISKYIDGSEVQTKDEEIDESEVLTKDEEAQKLQLQSPTLYYIQSDEKNEWNKALDWQIELINSNNISSSDNREVRIYKNFIYYHKPGKKQGHDIPIILNLDTGKIRLVEIIQLPNHKGAEIKNKEEIEIIKNKKFDIINKLKKKYLYFIQSDEINKWDNAQKWQTKLINSNFNEKGVKESQHNNYKYYYYYSKGDIQGFYNEVILNLITGKTRLIKSIELPEHKGTIKENKKDLENIKKNLPHDWKQKQKKCKHYRYHEFINNPNKFPKLPKLPKRIQKEVIVTKFEVIIDKGGLTNVGVDMKKIYPNSRIGTMIAGNSGRTGGACGSFDKAVKLHAGHTTQEEDVVSNWLITATEKKREKIIDGKSDIANKIFKETIYNQWGMKNPEGTDYETIQDVNYTKADPYMYADAWIVPNAELSYKNIKNIKNKIFDINKTYSTTLVFVSGPNIGEFKMRDGVKDKKSTMNRTWNTKMKNDYELFKNGVKAALFAGLCAMAEDGCTIALLAFVSAGIYGGDYRDKLRDDYEKIVNEVLSQKCLTKDSGKEVRLGQYFERVILTKLEK